jgi:hypothetical protein
MVAYSVSSDALMKPGLAPIAFRVPRLRIFLGETAPDKDGHGGDREK